MKHSIIIILLFYSLQSSAQHTTNLLLHKAQTGSLTSDEAKELKALGYSIQNRGFILDERDHDYKNALQKIDSALMVWIALKDTSNEANNRKYKGYLLGRLQQFTEAKKEIEQAIFLFTIKNKDDGIAVSRFDLARVYDMESKPDSAIHYANLALLFWKNRQDTSRILIINNLLTSLYLSAGQFKKAETIQKESFVLSDNKNLHWQEEIDFYFISSRLYRKLKQLRRARIYKRLYNTKIKILKLQGIIARSYFETL